MYAWVRTFERFYNCQIIDEFLEEQSSKATRINLTSDGKEIYVRHVEFVRGYLSSVFLNEEDARQIAMLYLEMQAEKKDRQSKA